MESWGYFFGEGLAPPRKPPPPQQTRLPEADREGADATPAPLQTLSNQTSAPSSFGGMFRCARHSKGLPAKVRPVFPCFSGVPRRGLSQEPGNEALGATPLLSNLLVFYLNHETPTCVAENSFPQEMGAGTQGRFGVHPTGSHSWP